MKVLRKRMIYYVVIALVGALILAVGLVSQLSSSVASIGGGLLAVALVKLLQFSRIRKDPTRMRQYEIAQNEERLIMIAHKSGYLTLQLTLFAELGCSLVLCLIGKAAVGEPLLYLAAMQSVLYLGLYWYTAKRN